MREYSGLLRDSNRVKGARFQPAVLLLAPLAAILFQVYVPVFFRFLAYLELPLLVTVYFALMRRHAIAGLFYGAAIGLAQDSLSNHPLGMFGIVKTLVGYFAASLSVRFDVENPVMRLILASLFFLFHQVFYWLLGRALLGSAADLGWHQLFLLAALNGVVAVPLFSVLDRLRTKG